MGAIPVNIAKHTASVTRQNLPIIVGYPLNAEINVFSSEFSRTKISAGLLVLSDLNVRRALFVSSILPAIAQVSSAGALIAR